MIVGMQAKETGDGAGRGSKLWVAPKTPYSLRLYEVFGNTIRERERERMGAGGGEGGRRFTVIAAHHFSVIVLFVAMTEQGEGHMRHSWRVQHKRVPARVQFHPLVGPALSSVFLINISTQGPGSTKECSCPLPCVLQCVMCSKLITSCGGQDWQKQPISSTRHPKLTCIKGTSLLKACRFVQEDGNPQTVERALFKKN